MWFADLKLSEKRLPGFPFSPIVAVEHLGGMMREVVMSFGFGDEAATPDCIGRRSVGDIPTFLPKQFREVSVGGRQRLRILDIVGM
jgi:hypothetical protein